MDYSFLPLSELMQHSQSTQLAGCLLWFIDTITIHYEDKSLLVLQKFWELSGSDHKRSLMIIKNSNLLNWNEKQTCRVETKAKQQQMI
jgi:hypothetical protein